jgi:hypothetical protein
MHTRMNKIKSRWPDVYKAYQFCRENRDKFIGRIHGPIALQINVKDIRYSSMIEQILGGSKSTHFRVKCLLKVYFD